MGGWHFAPSNQRAGENGWAPEGRLKANFADGSLITFQCKREAQFGRYAENEIERALAEGRAMDEEDADA